MPVDKEGVASSPGLQPASSTPKQVFRFVARQPILNREQQVFAYELLFRDGIENFFRATDSEAAARSTLDSTLLMGFDVLCDGQKAFINCTRDLLLKDGITLLPAEQTVVEVLEDIEPDDLVIAACQRLSAAGYKIALDDFIANDPRGPMTPLADFIKVDFERTTPAERKELVKRYGTPRCQMLAEKVETREQFETALNDGFVYFQGYFFRRPEVLKAREIPANQVNYLRMLQAVSLEEVDIRELEKLIKTEASVLYRLLRYLNSPVFGMRNEIHSIRHALAILGEREIRRWIRLVALVSAGQLKTSDLVLSALVRARFCELLSRKISRTQSGLFLVGMLSMMDAILDIPIAEVLQKIAIDSDTKCVLSGNGGRLQPVYDLMIAQEAGNWAKAEASATALRLGESEVGELWWQAMQWARQVSTGK
ncbi:MAG TPA: HDOD domain-containing protein [Terriglobales bacterium]|nr:HDOD domain-containing protein [Terriglobales bacterium]